MADKAQTLLYIYLCINFSYVYSVQEYDLSYTFIAHKLITYNYYSVNTNFWLLQQFPRQPVASIHSWGSKFWTPLFPLSWNNLLGKYGWSTNVYMIKAHLHGSPVTYEGRMVGRIKRKSIPASSSSFLLFWKFGLNDPSRVIVPVWCSD
jgi:hypothetical protein